MDAVITYVNGNDPQWRKTFVTATGGKELAKRFRDWGFLPYLMRGIEKFMPFIEKVFLVVASESQIPTWVNRDKVQIVLHKDIIPAEFLPTFNSTTIELFLHRIKGLSERFIYFNDDFYPVQALTEKDFFEPQKVVIHFSKHLLATNLYKKQCRQSDRYARMANQQHKGCLYIRPQHTCVAMLRSSQEQVYQLLAKHLAEHITATRREDNVNQYLYSDYLYYNQQVVNRRLSTKHCSMAVYTPEKIAEYITHPQSKIVCINDVEMSKEKEARVKHIIQNAFVSCFPHKSRFEL